MIKLHDQGIALICDLQGRVCEIIRDNLDLGPRLRPGTPIVELADIGNQEKARHFLEVIHATGAALGWEINVLLEGGLVPLHWGGGVHEERLVVVIARTRTALAGLTEELMRINNEQTNAFRSLAKEIARLVQSQGERDARLLEELTQLNNDLAALQREMAKKNAELERLNQLKNQFLGIAAHDLRSPLGVIQIYSQFLETELGPAVSEEHSRFIVTIRQTSESLLRLVDNLLDVSQIEAGKLELNRQPLDLRALVERNLAFNRVLAGKTQRQLVLVTPESTPLLLDADGPKLEQVLNNLIGNALKFSPPGTRVEVSLAREGDRAVVSVRDRGPGIPAEEVGKLFRFFQKTSVRGIGGERGSGLGLAIARKIVEGHGGAIQVETEPGRGSVFSFALPVTTPRDRGP
ncbi:MAG: ATP-binding protein [Candidatus Contendobacter sp.]|nr:ATP-binding protein [Candidatus Contendobacter sp.]MDG4559530.1 ATP-binding protein [Candidatus Contendobacter sp.]